MELGGKERKEGRKEEKKGKKEEEKKKLKSLFQRFSNQDSQVTFQ